MPSNLLGLWTHKEEATSDYVSSAVGKFIEINLKCVKRPPPLLDQAYKLEYDNFGSFDEDLIDLFNGQYSELDNPEDKLLYLFERIVFDSYLQDGSWWQAKIAAIAPQNNVQVNCRDILSAIQEYMASWKPHPNPRENRIDYNGIYNAQASLVRCLNAIEREAVTDIVRMVATDYLGLAMHKLGSPAAGFRFAERRKFLEGARQHFEQVVQYSTMVEKKLELWKGYAAFNLARTIDDTLSMYRDNDVPSDENLEREFRKRFHEAISVRRKWLTTVVNLPKKVKDGLKTEYYWAVAQRVKRTRRDDSKRIVEAPPYEMSEDKIREYRDEYLEWWESEESRVRLANNVKEVWDSQK